MLKFSVKSDIAAARRTTLLAQKEIERAAMRALDRVSTTVRRTAADSIGSKLALRKGDIRKQVTIARPLGRAKLVRDIVASGRPVPLRDYQARRTKKGVTFKVARAGQRKLYKAKGNAGFIVDRKGGHVFVRTEPDPPGPQKGRIRKVYGPSLPQYFVTRYLINAMRRVVAQRWPIEFAREIKFRSSRAART